MRSPHVVVKDRLSSLDPADESFKYLKGKEYSRPWTASFDIFGLEHKLSVLDHLYPYQTTIRQTNKSYHDAKASALLEGALVTATSWFLIFQFARRGVVAPVLKQYGSFFNTHRVFRHYLYSLLLPIPTLVMLNAMNYVNHTELLWHIHSRRLNNNVLQDPKFTVYPPELRTQRSNIRVIHPYRPTEANEEDERLSKVQIEELPEFEEPEEEGEEGESEE